jgi:hypothetical protein
VSFRNWKRDRFKKGVWQLVVPLYIWTIKGPVTLRREGMLMEGRLLSLVAWCSP